MTEPRITLKGQPALLAMRLLSLIDQGGEFTIQIDARRRDALRWRPLQSSPWERQHQENTAPIDADVR
jgi:hypothetical protein